MDDLYKQLEFKKPTFLENPYGIRIYIGTKDKDDWGVVIPAKLAKMKCGYCDYYNCNQDYNVYLVTEQYALRVAKEYTELARKKLTQCW